MDQLTPVTNVTMDKDIDLVLITGAEASREFDTQGTKLPLMGDWSEALIGKLCQKGPDYLGVTGLRSGMSGPEFGAQLDQCLQQDAVFSTVKGINKGNMKELTVERIDALLGKSVGVRITYVGLVGQR